MCISDNIKNRVFAEDNLLAAICSIKSYIKEVNLMEKADIDLFYKLQDIYDKTLINATIKKCKKKLEFILSSNSNFFDIKVFFKLKSYVEAQVEFRPIHSADLITQICITALLNILVYEKINNSEKYFSTLCQNIPSNFFGNQISSDYYELYKNWRPSFKNFSKKSVEKYYQHKNDGMFSTQVCLDIKNFYPSINPDFIYKKISSILNHHPEIQSIQYILKKLLYFNVSNLNSNNFKYYCGQEIKTSNNPLQNKGIPQGLPQADFLANFAMIEIAKIYENILPNEGLYYVDDSVLFTEKKASEIKVLINRINKEIQKEFTINNQEKFSSNIQSIYTYSISVHDLEGKSSAEDLESLNKPKNYLLHDIVICASNVSFDIHNTFNELDDESIMRKAKVYLDIIESELENKNIIDENYKKLLIRYKKFFQYRYALLSIRSNPSSDVVNQLLSDMLPEKFSDRYLTKKNIQTVESSSERGRALKCFFDTYDENAFQTVAQLQIDSDTSMNRELFIAKLKKIENYVTSNILNPNDLYFNNIFKISPHKTDPYKTIQSVISRNFPSYSKLNKERKAHDLCNFTLDQIALKHEFPIRIETNEYNRKLVNGYISHILSVDISDGLPPFSRDSREFNYSELRIITYIRNSNCDINNFFQFLQKIAKESFIQDERIDYSIFEVLDIFRKKIKDPVKIDILIKVHQYTSALWRNGSKFPYFYTLHNHEHSIELIKLSLSILNVIDLFKLDSDDFFALFLSCYLHDISMVEHPYLSSFIENVDESDKIYTNFREEWNDSSQNPNQKKSKLIMVDLFNKMSAYYDNSVRNAHAEKSAQITRTENSLSFIDKIIRENVAQISSAHSYDVNDVYSLKSNAQKDLFSLKYLMIVLRLADLLDVSRSRVSLNLLNKSVRHMDQYSQFHWISHLAIENLSFHSEYLLPENYPNVENEKIIEKISITFHLNHFNYSSVSKNDKCKNVNCSHKNISDKKIIINIVNTGNNSQCNKNSCTFLCKWMMKKNQYLLSELSALQEYLNSHPDLNIFHTQICIILDASNASSKYISQEHIDVVSKFVE